MWLWNKTGTQDNTEWVSKGRLLGPSDPLTPPLQVEEPRIAKLQGGQVLIGQELGMTTLQVRNHPPPRWQRLSVSLPHLHPDENQLFVIT